MANAADMKKRKPVRMMVVGFPGSAKTGMLASLANMGYKLRIMDFDGNTDPLIQYTKPEFLKNIDIVSFQDKMKMGPKYLEPAGVPTAFSDAMKLMNRWKYKDPYSGLDVDLGQPQDWGCDTVVVLDSLTSNGAAAKRRVMALNNKTLDNTTQAIWGISMDQQDAFVDLLTSEANGFHVIVLAHLKMIGPKEINSKDEQANKELQERMIDLIPSRYYPSALGNALPQTIGGHFPTLIEATSEKGKRFIRTIPRPELDLKVPSIQNLNGTPIETAYQKIFEALAPPLETCRGNDVVATHD